MEYDNPNDKTFLELVKNIETAQPTLDDQKAYLEKKRQELDQQLTETGTYVRVYDNISTNDDLGDNWDVSFQRNRRGELYANIMLFQEKKHSYLNSLSRTRRIQLTIAYRNDVSELTPTNGFTFDDIQTLDRHFYLLDSDKESGLLPNLTSDYEIFDSSTAISKLGNVSINQIPPETSAPDQ